MSRERIPNYQKEPCAVNADAENYGSYISRPETARQVWLFA